MVPNGLLVAEAEVRRVQTLMDQTAVDTWLVPEAGPTPGQVATAERVDLAGPEVITVEVAAVREPALYCMAKWLVQELRGIL